MSYNLHWRELFLFASLFKTIYVLFSQDLELETWVQKHFSRTGSDPLSGAFLLNTQNWHFPFDHWDTSMYILQYSWKPLLLQYWHEKTLIQLTCYMPLGFCCCTAPSIITSATTSPFKTSGKGWTSSFFLF